jgi:gamma-glutamylcyclotransferase (GGCT)/AIG2-like uncharacterized protein YtfP
MNNLFVYGTLVRRSRHPMARFLAERAVHVATAKVHGRLYDLGRYPGMLQAATARDWVHGDLYDLGEGTTTLAELDAYELAESPLPARFERGTAAVTLGDGTRVEAWVWWYRGDVDESQCIVSGRYETNCDPIADF